MCKHIYNPDQTYPKGTSFTYIISWTDLDIHYYGVRYKKTCHPDDLWNIYFTSSIPVKDFRLLNGEPDIIKVDFIFDTKEEAKEYEYYYIKNNNLVRDPKWLNKGNSGREYIKKDNYNHSEETKNKIAKANTGRIYISKDNKSRHIKSEFLQEFLNLGWEIKNPPRTPEHQKKLADSLRGKTHSEELKIKNSLAQKGKPKGPRTPEHQKKLADSLRGKIHINNGEIQLLVFHEEAEILYPFGFLNGILPESHQKHLDSVKGKIWINNGIIQTFASKDEAENIYYPQGFVNGMIKRRK